MKQKLTGEVGESLLPDFVRASDPSRRLLVQVGLFFSAACKCARSQIRPVPFHCHVPPAGLLPFHFGRHKSIYVWKPMELRHSPYRRQSSRTGKTAAPIASTAATSQSRSNAQKWTADEDSLLRGGVAEFGAKKWKQIAGRLEDRSPGECNARWIQLLGFGVVQRQPWSAAEDTEMVQLVKKYGAIKWSVIASHLPGRSSKQCRERWHNQVNPAIKKTPWTDEEDALIVRLQDQFGNSWAKITSYLPGRTDNAVKNRWHSSLKPPSKRRHAASRGERTAARKPKHKKTRSRKAKPRTEVKLEEVPVNLTPAVPVFTADEVDASPAAKDATSPGSAIEDLSTVVPAVAAESAGSCRVDGRTGDSMSTPIFAAVPGVDRKSFSPDTVSSVDNLELYAFPQSYQDGVVRAQAVINNILDPMGMGSCSPNSSLLDAPDVRVGETSFEHSFQQSASSWPTSVGYNDYYSVSNELSSGDPTSPARPPFGLDELLDDSLHDEYGGIASSDLKPSDLEPSSLVLSAPLGEVARVYHRSTLVTDGMACITYLSPSGPALVPTATYAQPGFDVVKREIPSVECGDFTIPGQSCPFGVEL